MLRVQSESLGSAFCSTVLSLFIQQTVINSNHEAYIPYYSFLWIFLSWILLAIMLDEIVHVQSILHDLASKGCNCRVNSAYWEDDSLLCGLCKRIFLERYSWWMSFLEKTFNWSPEERLKLSVRDSLYFACYLCSFCMSFVILCYKWWVGMWWTPNDFDD